VFAFNALRIRFTHRMLFGFKQLSVSSPPIGVKLLDAKRGEQRHQR
jgi:hypothetical protein